MKATLLSEYAPEFVVHAQVVSREAQILYASLQKSLSVPIASGLNHYHCYPFFFSPIFPCLSVEQIRCVALAGVLYLDQLCIVDRLVDQPADCAHHEPLLATLLHEESFKVLRTMFDSDDIFWDELASLNRAHTAAVMYERSRHHGQITSFETGEFFRIATGKAGVSKASHIALACLAGASSTISPLSNSQDYFNAAFQAFDDVKDWKADLKNGNYTNLLTTVLIDYPSSLDDLPASGRLANEISHSVYYGGCAEKILREAMEYCSKAIDAVDSARLPQWIRFVQAFSDRIRALHDDLESARLQTVLRSQGFLNKEPHVLLADGIAVLERDRANNYAEASHTMGFLWDTPDRQSRESQSGSVFQRAIIADVLLDLDDCGLLNYRSAPSGAANDCEILYAERLKDVRGGWSYFPSLDNLPPDADDLAQVMQVMTRSQFRDAEVIEDALQLLFVHGSHGDGSFETWIVDPKATDQATSRFLHGIENHWGKGADVEVVSNLGFALSLHNPNRYAAEIRAAAQYVESQQQDNGHWIPTWYASCWYGTYTATRFLASVAPGSDSLRISASLLPAEQKPDGGFGVTSSTPLETALALLAIRSLAIGDEVRDKIHARTRRYFQMSVRPDGSWDSSPFIQMDTHRASKGKPGYRPNLVHYGSRTLSTAYVVKALLVTDALKKR